MNRKLPIDILPFDKWPLNDRKKWMQVVRQVAHENEGRFEGNATLRIRLMRSAYGRWLGHLRSELPGIAINCGRDHVVEAVLSTYVERLLLYLRYSTVRSYLNCLQTTVRIMDPSKDFGLLTRACRNLKWLELAATSQRRTPVLTPELVRCGIELMERSKSCAGSRQAAVTFRDGLAIALLALRPIRYGNFARLNIDQHIDLTTSTTWFRIPGTEVRGGRMLEFPLPEILEENFREYLLLHRRSLMLCQKEARCAGINRLWLSRRGTPISPDAFRCRIKEATQKQVGTAIIPCMFRDAAARTIALCCPDKAGIILSILGYSSRQSAKKFTDTAEAIEATRDYHSILKGYSRRDSDQ